MLSAKWGLIDDHEILALIGPNSHLPISNFIQAISSTELSWNSVLTRFRPSYYFLRISEAVFWGKDAQLWYGFRMAIAIFCGISLAKLSIILVGPFIGFGFILFSLTPSYWADIFAKAGPSEVYAVLGCAILALYFSSKINQFRYSAYDGLILSLGIIISVGAKENFLFLSVIPLYILIHKRFQKTIGSIFFLGISLLFIAYIVVSLYLRFRGVNHDIYQNEISLISRILLFKSFFLQKNIIAWTLLFLLCLFIFLITYSRFISLSNIQKFKLKIAFNKFFKWQFLLFSLYASQYIFYFGTWGDSSARYYFPATLLFQFAILLTISYLLEFDNILRIKNLNPAILQFTFLLLFLLPSVDKFFDNRHLSQHHSQISIDFDKKFNSIANFLEVNPTVPLIIVSYRPSDYESIFAINRFLYSEGIPNRLGIMLGERSYTNIIGGDSHKRLLQNAISDLSKNGERNRRNDSYFDPVDSLDPYECISVGINGPHLSTCKYGGVRIWD